jgi:hypothetical protein
LVIGNYTDLLDYESDSSGDLGHSDSEAELVEVSYVIVVGKASASGWGSAPFILVPPDGVFGRTFPPHLAALRGCHTLYYFCFFVCILV